MSNHSIRLKSMWVFLCAITLLFNMLMLKQAFAQPEGVIFDKSNGENSGSTGKMIYQGYTYKVVKVGTQWWMAENLRVSNYNDGTEIVHAVTNKEWRRLKKTESGGWCYFNNDQTIGNKAGKLYNWYAVNSGKLAPNGWRVPSKEEFLVLIKNLYVMYDLVNKPLKEILIIDNIELNDKDLEKEIATVYNDAYKWYSYKSPVQKNIVVDKKTLKQRDKFWDMSTILEGSRVINKDEWFYIAKKMFASHKIRIIRMTNGFDKGGLPELFFYSEIRYPPGYNISGLSFSYKGHRRYWPEFKPIFAPKDPKLDAYWTTSQDLIYGRHEGAVAFKPEKLGSSSLDAELKRSGYYVRCVLK